MGSKKRLLWSFTGRSTFGEPVVVEIWYGRNVEPDRFGVNRYLPNDFHNAIEVSICHLKAVEPLTMGRIW